MNNKIEIIKQTKGAFDFLQKLYFEVSYMIKEAEGLLGEEPEEFIIGKPSGYGINTRTSTGLESNNVNYWLMRRMAVFFVPKVYTEGTGGTTTTHFNEDLKILYLRVVLDDREITEPVVYAGVFYDFEKKEGQNRMQKFEHAMNHFEYNENKFIKKAGDGVYDDNYLKFRWNVFECNLFDLNSGSEVAKKLVEPMVELYRKV